MASPDRNFGPAIALVVTTAVWGYNWIVVKVALLYAPALTFGALRSVFSGLFLFLVMLLLRQSLRPARGKSLLLLALLQTMGFVGFSSLALKTGAAGKSVVLAYTMPFWALMVSGPLVGEYVRRAQLPAVVLAAFGLVSILSPWSGTLDYAASLYAIGAAITWALSNIVAKRMQLGDGELVNVAAWQMFYGGIGLSVLALLLDNEPVNWTPQFSVSLAYNVFLATALAWFLWLYALNKLSVGVTGIASLATPAMVIVVAWAQLGEIPTLAEAAGMLLILVALAWLSVVEWRRYSPRASDT